MFLDNAVPRLLCELLVPAQGILPRTEKADICKHSASKNKKQFFFFYKLRAQCFISTIIERFTLTFYVFKVEKILTNIRMAASFFSIKFRNNSSWRQVFLFLFKRAHFLRLLTLFSKCMKRTHYKITLTITVVHKVYPIFVFIFTAKSLILNGMPVF